MSEDRIITYGGQAVIEGVLMRGRKAFTIAMRAPDGNIVLHTEKLAKVYQSGIAKIPFLRGVILLWDALGLGMRALTLSANTQTGEDEKLEGAPLYLTLGLSLAFGIGLFFLLPAFLGGWVDNIIQTISDSVITIPSLAVLIVISSYVRQIDITNMGLLLALFAWPGPTRVIRSQVLSMRERGYVRMARLSCVSTPAIMFKELLPNLLPYLAASFTGSVSGNILAATGLEALGLGPSRIPTLGMTIFYAIRASAIIRGMWWWWGFPILMLILIFVALFLMTIGMDEVANPRLRKAKA